MKIFRGIILIFTLLLGVFLGNSFYFSRKNLNEIKKKSYEIEKIHKVYLLRDERRRCISKTLTIAYDLSNWESYCYSMIFDEISCYYKINWEIFAALIRVETNFNPTLKSPAHCKGLMQLKEATGKEVAEKLDINYVENQSLWNDFINILLGSHYLAEFIKERGIEGGIKSYLGGPDYLKSVKKKGETFRYVREYKIKVSEEYKQLKYIFRGVIDKYSKFNFNEIETSFKTDSSVLIFEVLKKAPQKIKPKNR